MNLWIRTQNKEKLIPINEPIYITYGVDSIWRIRCGIELGHYKTEERALEILDEISHRIALLNVINLHNYDNGLEKISKIDEFEGVLEPYQMPEE